MRAMLTIKSVYNKAAFKQLILFATAFFLHTFTIVIVITMQFMFAIVANAKEANN